MQKKALSSLKLSKTQIFILIACVLIQATTVAFVNNAQSLFFQPISADLQVNKATVALCSTIASLSAMFSAPLWGLAYGRAKVRRLFFPSIFLFGLTYIGMSRAANLPALYLYSVVIGVLFSAVAMLPVSVMINKSFSDNLGLAFSVAYAGSGLGGMLFNPLINTFISRFGWRIAYLSMGTIVLLITLPVCYFLFVEDKQLKIEQTAISEKIQEPKRAKTSPIMKQAWFWIFMLACCLTSVSTMGALMNVASFMQDLNFASAKVSLVCSAYSGTLILGKFILGSLFDRRGATAGTIVGNTAMGLACLLLLFFHKNLAIVLFVAFFGVGAAIGTITTSWLCNKLCGREDYSRYMGMVQFAQSLGGALGMPLVAWLRDQTGSYSPAWILLAIICLVFTLAYLYSIHQSKVYWSKQLIAGVSAE